MFENVEKKLKTLAKVNLVCGFILAFIFFALLLGPGRSGDDVTVAELVCALVVSGFWILMGFITSWPIYAYAEIVESTKETNQILKCVFQGKMEVQQQKEKAIEEQRMERARLEVAKAEVERQARQEAEDKIKKEREDRISAYWAEHIDEKNALLAKKAEAEIKMKMLSGLATEERKAIQSLIEAIDLELTRDR